MIRCFRPLCGVLLTAMASTSLLACTVDNQATDDSEDISAIASPIYALMSARWTTRRIPVCWENPGSWTTERKWVRDAVDRTWARQTGFVFTGWGACAADDTGLRIQITDTDDPNTTTNEANPRTEGLGNALNGMANGMKLNFSFNAWGTTCQTRRQSCIEAIGVHEFGHALGLSHEQNRPDTPVANQGNNQGPDGDQVFGAWDLFSTMNYENPRWNNDGLLSSVDVAGTRAAYEGGPVKLINHNSSLCVGVPGFDHHGAGQSVESYYCEAVAGDQKRDGEWIPERVPNTNFYRLVNSSSGLCLGVAGVDHHGVGARVEVYFCDADAWDPRLDGHWSLSLHGGATTIANRASGLCLGTPNLPTPGSGLGVYTCDQNGNQGQIWYAKGTSVTAPTERTTIRLRNMANHLCLGTVGVDATGISSGSTETYYCDPDPNDPRRDGEWTVEPTSGGYFRLRNAVSNLCLGVVGVDHHGVGASTEVYSCNPTATDALRDGEWIWVNDTILVSSPNGGTTNLANPREKWLRNRVSGLCLGVRGVNDGGPGAGTEVYHCGSAPGDSRRDQVWLPY